MSSTRRTDAGGATLGDTASTLLYRLGLALGAGAFVVFTVYVAEYTTWGETVPEKFGIDGLLGPHPEYVAVGLFVLGAVSFVASLAVTLAIAEE